MFGSTGDMQRPFTHSNLRGFDEYVKAREAERMKECFHLERTVEDSVVQDYTKPIRVKHLSSEVHLCECTSLVKTGVKCCWFGVCIPDVFSWPGWSIKLDYNIIIIQQRGTPRSFRCNRHDNIMTIK